MIWLLVLAGAGIASFLVRLPLEMRVVVHHNAAAARLVLLRLPLLQSRLVWRRLYGRLRWRALGGRFQFRNLGPLELAADWFEGPLQLARAWRRTSRAVGERVRAAARRILRVLLRRARVDRAVLHVRHGTGRPDRTGYLCGGYYALAPVWFWLRPLLVTSYAPDFERRIFRAHARARMLLPLYLLPLLFYWLIVLHRAAARAQTPRSRSVPEQGGLDAAR